MYCPIYVAMILITLQGFVTTLDVHGEYII